MSTNSDIPELAVNESKPTVTQSHSLEQHDFGDSKAPPIQSATNRLQVVLDIPVTLSMELGRTRMSIRDLLQLTQGSVVKLDQPAGEPLDLLVNGCLVARGEVVVVNERYGIRITDIMSAEERIKRV